MDDYISREAAKLAAVTAAQSRENGFQWGETVTFTTSKIIRLISSIPAADVRPVVMGHWEDENKSTKNPERHAFNWWCSICGTPQHTPVAKTLAEFTMENPYCHNCGAYMREVKEDGK